jgi:hypothetical protein
VQARSACTDSCTLNAASHASSHQVDKLCQCWDTVAWVQTKRHGPPLGVCRPAGSDRYGGSFLAWRPAASRVTQVSYSCSVAVACTIGRVMSVQPTLQHQSLPGLRDFHSEC